MGRPALPISDPSEAEIASFWRRVDRSPGGVACWPWIGGHNLQGYGVVRFGGRMMNASRASWYLANGQIPDGSYVLHRCDNPVCVNPRHLFAGTQRENVADMDGKGRRARGYRVSIRGENHAAARLTDEAVAAIRSALAEGRTRRSIAREFGVSHTYVGMLARGELRVG